MARSEIDDLTVFSDFDLKVGDKRWLIWDFGKMADNLVNYDI